jgi:hypothetical protein
MIKPIKTHDAYFFSNEKRLWGIEEKQIKNIEVIDQDGDVVTINDFFTKSGSIYFQVTEIETEKTEIEDGKGNKEKVDVDKMIVRCYCQKAGTITEISELPERPAANRSHLNTKEFSITDFDFEGKPCSDVKNLTRESGIERFFMVDGFYHYEGSGLFFAVSDGRYNEETVVREAGLYYWSTKNSGIEYLERKGTFWKS